jgi:hypothetical protein
MGQKNGLQVVDAGTESHHSLLIGRRGATNDSRTEVDKVRGPIHYDRCRRPGTHRIGTGVSLLVFGSNKASAQNPSELRSPSEFSGIQDPQTRSRALFTEAAKVIMNPRCMSCHPASDSPLQGNDQHIHTPPVTRGNNGGGVAGNTCGACHMERNFTLMEKASYQSIPGHPRWGLAPIEMAWEGKSVGEICAQLKEPGRNGGRNLTLLHEHLATDDLVAWGWNPGLGRDPAPGTQERLGELIKAWIDTGAQCPL